MKAPGPYPLLGQDRDGLRRHGVPGAWHRRGGRHSINDRRQYAYGGTDRSRTPIDFVDSALEAIGAPMIAFTKMHASVGLTTSASMRHASK